VSVVYKTYVKTINKLKSRIHDNHMSRMLLKENISLDSCGKAWPKLECLWSSPPSVLIAAIDEVHVWRIPLDLPSGQIQRIGQTLSSDEQSKANRFHFERDRRRYIASHGTLRNIIGKYLCVEPGQLKFYYSPLGKPFLVSDKNTEQLCFNLSHSNEYALCAVTLNREIGIDLEYIRPNPDTESMARRLFSHREYETIYSFSPNQRQQAFFDLWTLKEAYLKATGKGIGGLEQVEISLSSTDAPSLLVDSENKCVTDRWTILQFKPAQGYTAGLAVEGKDVCINKFMIFK